MTLWVDPDRTRAPKRRWRSWLVGLAVLAAVLLTASVIYARGHHDPTRSVASPSSSFSTRPPEAPGIVGGFSDIRYVKVFDTTVPQSPTAGPSQTGDGRAAGFRHDDVGAVLAGMNIAVRAAPVAGPAVFTETIAAQCTGPEQAKQALQDAALNQYRSLSADPSAARYTGSYIGYRLDNQATDPDNVSMTVTARVNSPTTTGQYTLISQALNVRWINGDWRLTLPWSDPVEITAAPPGTAALPGQQLTLTP